MNEVRFLETKFGGWWCGVKLTDGHGERDRRPERPMRFCEAIAASRTGPIVLSPKSLNCPGGRHAFGWNSEDETSARDMAEKAGMDVATARKVVRDTPALKDDVAHITVGTYDSPDVVVSYAQPEAAMRVLRAWQGRDGRPLVTEASGFMSVCGAVAVKAYLTGTNDDNFH